MKEMAKFSMSWYWKMKWLILSSYFFTIIGMTTTSLIPKQIGICIDTIKYSLENDVSVNLTPIYLLAVYIVLTFVFMVCMVILRRFAHFTFHKKLQEKLYNQLLRLGNNFYQRNKTGYLVTVMNQDVDVFARFIYSFFFIFPELIIMLGISFYLILNIDLTLGILLSFVVALLVPINIKVIKRFKDVYRQLQKQISKVNDEIELCFYGIPVVKAYQREIAKSLKFKRIMGGRAVKDYEAFKFRMIISSFFWFLPGLLTTVVLFYGGFKLIQRYWSVGDLSAVIGYMWMITVPMMFLGQVIADYNWAKACFERIKRVLGAKAEIIETSKSSEITAPLYFKDSIEINNVSFHYEITESEKSDETVKSNGKIGKPKKQRKLDYKKRFSIDNKRKNGDVFLLDKEKPEPYADKDPTQSKTFDSENKKIKTVFNKINVLVRKGDKVGILGGVGSGKSTLFQLLLRLLNVTEGEITLDGVNIENLNLFNYRRLFGYVPQEPILFSDTVRQNIIFGREGLTEEDILKAVQIAQFDKEIAQFDNGLDELIGPNGFTLSGGQRQRLALSRALVHNPAILLFDDTTSALDTKTENALWKSVNRELEGITKLVITHRASTVMDADSIYVLDDGKVFEEGSPNELLKRDTYFRSLYNRQVFDTDANN